MTALGHVVIEHGPNDPPLIAFGMRKVLTAGEAATKAEQATAVYPRRGITYTACALVPLAEYEAMVAELTRYRTLTEDARQAYMNVMGAQVADAHEDGDET